MWSERSSADTRRERSSADVVGAVARCVGRPDSGRSGFTPSLFEKGSFAESKIRDVQRAGSGETPLSGRGSDRSARGSAYADFAARMRGAESNRSERSARGSSRPW